MHLIKWNLSKKITSNENGFVTKFFSLFFPGVKLLDLQGPVFLHEPPHKVEFSNNTGGHIECSGHGSPPPEVCIFNYFFFSEFNNFLSMKKEERKIMKFSAL